MMSSAALEKLRQVSENNPDDATKSSYLTLDWEKTYFQQEACVTGLEVELMLQHYSFLLCVALWEM